jgi:hypothetical protein
MFFSLLILTAFTQITCEETLNGKVSSEGVVLSIAELTKCPSCPYDKVDEDLIVEKQFNKDTADAITKDMSDTLFRVASINLSKFPACPQPCTADHKAIPILKISPAKVNTKITCAKQYLKTYDFEKIFKDKPGKSCKSKVDGASGDWIRRTLVNPGYPFSVGATQEGKDLWNKCPSACSYYTSQVLDYNITETSCELKLTLVVDCGQPKEDTVFIGKGYIRDHLVCRK